ncbi:hypothetical protein DH2020_034969 [Rehmannia glutinosa]|uniref:Uncharacterized protein n=1 Tax=Rehmannia glutinosa TaxID=99300 RepID=A0ABR0V9N9_REHGL
MEKQGQITKDEEEVAETLYALASMFSDTNKANQPGSDDEPPETKSSAIPEAGSSMNAVEDSGIPTLREESTKISSKVTLEASSKQPSPPSGSVVESDFGVGPRPRASTFDTTPSGEHAIDLEKTPARFASTNIACQPPVIENSITTEKYTRVAVESKKTWKRSSAHVYISRLIKVLQISEGKELSLEKPTQLTTSVDAHQMTGINGRNGGLSFNGIDPAAEKDSSAEIQNDILLHKGPIQDQPLVQLPQYLSSTANSSFPARTGRQLDLQQQKWAAQLSTQYNNGGVGSPNLPDWKNGKMDSPSSMLNYTQAIFPHLLSSKYQQFSPQQQQLMSINSSLHHPNIKLHHHQFPLGFERNGAAFYSENIPQLQLPCDQHL